MPTLHARSEILLGKATLDYLRQQHVMVAGLDGVGGYVAENLARAGIGELTLLDKDRVAMSNINRQIVALHSTYHQQKTAVMRARIHDIDPSIRVNIRDEFMRVETAEAVVLSGQYSYIADCIDTIACKAQLVFAAQKHDTAIISAMGAGNRIDASRVKVASLHQTQGCRLAREMRQRLRELKAGLKYPVVYSDEPVYSPPRVTHLSGEPYREKSTNGTISYLPAMIGVLLAGELLKSMLDKGSAQK